ncbi:hypothetical protein NQ317_008979 [Molorchus minor]|uniref:Uncharacterized protein n=1 Tax=Molorchus minor TaxID=1323400 RepID=A0ABQ9JBS0_9CUCU|nr:hypothetical protein NQ317_008979 [Molorchus minor]
MAHVYARPHHMLQTEEEVLDIVEDDPSTSTREIARQEKDNSFDWEGGIKALEANAPASISAEGVKTIANCKDAVKTKDDKCVAAYEIAKCLYDDNPSNYFLP